MSIALLLLAACNPNSPEGEAAAELQLEAASVTIDGCTEVESCDDGAYANGILAVTRTEGDGGVDLMVNVGETAIPVHSPTDADLSEFVGTEITAAIRGDWMVPMSLQLSDDAGPVYVVEAGSGDTFGVVQVAYGEELGQIVDEMDYQLTFHAIDVTTDDGVVSVKPGEIVTIHVNGQAWRFGAIASYDVDTIEGGEYSDCGGELPLLSYELVRLPEDRQFESVARPASRPMALYSGCGA